MTVVTSEQGFTSYSPEETSLLDFHYSNLEFACGAQLSQVTHSQLWKIFFMIAKNFFMDL